MRYVVQQFWTEKKKLIKKLTGSIIIVNSGDTELKNDSPRPTTLQKAMS